MGGAIGTTNISIRCALNSGSGVRLPGLTLDPSYVLFPMASPVDTSKHL